MLNNPVLGSYAYFLNFDRFQSHYLDYQAQENRKESMRDCKTISIKQGKVINSDKDNILLEVPSGFGHTTILVAKQLCFNDKFEIYLKLTKGN